MTPTEPPSTETNLVRKPARDFGPDGPTLWERMKMRKWLWGSVAFHGALALGFMVWQLTPAVEARKTFMKPKGGGEAARQGSELKMSLGKKQSVTSAPEQAKRVVTNSAFAMVALPDMPLMPAETTDVFAGRPSGLGGTGSDVGPTGKKPGGTAGDGSGITIFQVRSRAKSVVFLMDLSSSMVMSYHPPPVPGKLAPPKVVKDDKSYAVAEREVIRAINALDPSLDFSLICFAGEVACYRQGMGTATEAEKGKAVKFLQERSPALDLVAERKRSERAAAGFSPVEGAPKAATNFNHGGTNTSGALDAAFALNPDLIFLVSDGVPSDKSSASILAQVKERQAKMPRPIAINVIAYLADSGQEFMKSLAEQNQGSFKEIKPGMAGTGL